MPMNPTLHRRSLLGAAAALAASCTLPASSRAAPLLTVTKTPWCGCCAAWAKRMEQAGFAVALVESEDLEPLKRSLGVPLHLEACHTAEIEGYAVEGHVPPEAVARLLAERPEGVAGLAVPGMPAGSPGMETGTSEPYDVIAFGPAGEEVFLSVVP